VGHDGATRGGSCVHTGRPRLRRFRCSSRSDRFERGPRITRPATDPHRVRRQVDEQGRRTPIVPQTTPTALPRPAGSVQEPDSRAGHRLLSEPTRLERQRRRPGDSPADARGPRSSRRLVARPAEGASRGDTDRRPGAALRRRATPRRAVKEGRRIVGNRLCERAEDSSRIDVCGLVWRRKHRWRPPIGTDLSFSPNRVDHSRRVRSGLAIPVGRARQPREIREIPVGIGGDDGGAPSRQRPREPQRGGRLPASALSASHGYHGAEWGTITDKNGMEIETERRDGGEAAQS